MADFNAGLRGDILSATLVEFPAIDVCDIPQSLRNLANSIESGEQGSVYGLAWVLDSNKEGDDCTSCGYIGQSTLPEAEAYLLLGRGMRCYDSN